VHKLRPSIMIAGDTAQGLTGTVRSYNGSKGYGFITGPEGAFNDVMFARKELPEDAKEVRGNFMEGRTVIFDAHLKPDGRAKASSVFIQSDEDWDLPGRITSFGEADGCGFLSSTCFNEEVRFQVSELPDIPPGVDPTGQLVIFRATQDEDGSLKTTKILFQTAKMAEKIMTGASIPGVRSNVSGQLKRGAGMMDFSTMQQPFKQQAFGTAQRPLKQVALVPFNYIAQQATAAIQAAMEQPIKQQKSDPVPVTPTGRHMKGVVKSYNPSKGWGLITSPGIPSGSAGKAGDVFFLKSNLPLNVRDVDISGYKVGYELMRAPNGNLRAQHILMT